MSDVNVFVAFAAGIFSFLSPCVLPLVPGYISLISGTGAAALENREQQRVLGKVMLNSLMSHHCVT